MNTVSHSRVTSGRLVWLTVTTLLTAITLVTMWGPLSDSTWERPEVLFALVTGSATLCILGATIVIALADQRQLAEFGLLGSALLAASVMPLVHGLVTPGVLYNETPAFRTSAFLSLPIAVAVAAPLLSPHSAFGRWAARRWRDWTLLSMVGVFIVASIVVFYPDAIIAPSPTSALAIGVTIAMLVAVTAISLRQLRYFELGHSPANMVASLSLVLLAGTAVLPLSTTDYSAGFWWLHICGALGVLGACVGLAVSKRMTKNALDLLGPVLLRDPLVAFELGLSPTVHRFVAALEEKDQITRDHVIRTAEMAIRVGERFRLSARELRNLGLAALLHDVGKLNIPDAVLTKPARLTAEEYEVVKLHAVDGERMLLAEPTLASVAPIVRSHHERIDGRGYPDGLMGKAIPLPSRIIAVCDAFDAMTHDRQYRTAMSVRMAFAVLNEHAGSQWDTTVIEQVMTVLPSMPPTNGLDHVGRDGLIGSGDDRHDEMSTLIPDDVGALLAAVDVEI